MLIIPAATMKALSEVGISRDAMGGRTRGAGAGSPGRRRGVALPPPPSRCPRNLPMARAGRALARGRGGDSRPRLPGRRRRHRRLSTALEGWVCVAISAFAPALPRVVALMMAAVGGCKTEGRAGPQPDTQQPTLRDGR